MAADVQKARKRFNFSEWDSIFKGDQEAKLWYIVNMIDAGKMPLPAYAAVHPGAKVSEKELNILKNYVIELSGKSHRTGDTSKIKVPVKMVSENPQSGPHNFPKSINGISYFDDYKHWKVIGSTTERCVLFMAMTLP